MQPTATIEELRKGLHGRFEKAVMARLSVRQRNYRVSRVGLRIMVGTPQIRDYSESMVQEIDERLDVDHRQPCQIRPRQAALTDRPDRGGVGTRRTAHPTSQTRRARLRGRCARGRQQVMYVLSTGCQWRYIPKDLPPKSTLHQYLARWNDDNTLTAIHHAIVLQCREMMQTRSSGIPSA